MNGTLKNASGSMMYAAAISFLLISAAGASAPAVRAAKQKFSLPPDSEAILVEDYTGDAAAFVADQDASTAQLVLLADKKQGKSHVSEDGQLIFLRANETEKANTLIRDSLGKRWVKGVWVLCHDPDRSPKHSIEFTTGGQGVLAVSKQPPRFAYGMGGNVVTLVVNAGGRPVIMKFTFSPDRQKLETVSEKSGNTSTYVRADGKLVGECTVK
jgi:hypothetical protein